jgi:hypothetical protein
MAEYIPHDDPRRADNLEDFHGKTPEEIKETRWFHGTKNNFNSFKAGQLGMHQRSRAIFVTPDLEFANKYASSHWDEQDLLDDRDHAKFYNRPPSQPNIMPVHIRAEKPFDYENFMHVNDVLSNIRYAHLSDEEAHNINKLINKGSWEIIESEPVQEAIKKLGYDSFFVKEDGVKNLGVYDPTQIKSATGNQGTFDPSNPDITKRDGGDVEGEDQGITAYHGSPHDFEQFDTSKIGTGEGAQAYGHGLYFAESEPVAEGYRNRLSGYHPGSVKIGGEEHPHWSRREVANAFAKLGYDPETSVFAAHLINEHQGDLDSAVNSLLDFKPVEEGKFGETEKINDNLLKALMEAEPVNYKGHMYEVHIDAHPDHFLDWDKPLSEQSDHVQNAVKQSLEYAKKKAATPEQRFSWSSVFKRPDEFLDYTGSSIQNLLGRNLGLQDASDALAKHGIKGIRYLDAGSRDSGEGSRNYVVFDHNNVAVKRKYAQGGIVEEAA